ncbi:hypothetical protein pb186bvf_015003 [Paramecium bursaria]
MYLQPQVPRARLSLTPTTMKPIQVEFVKDLTPVRSQNISYIDTSQQYSIDQPLQSINFNVITGRTEDRLSQNRSSIRNIKKEPYRSDKENLTRVPGNSFCGKEPSNKELQFQIAELRKQKENMCFTLAETLQKNQQLKQNLDTIQRDKDQQAQQYQTNLDQFVQELNGLHSIIRQLEEHNCSLLEQNETYQWQIEQLQTSYKYKCSQQSSFNITQNFGSS